MQPTFSIIIAVRNAVGTIEASLQSILQQTYESYELVIIDAVSTDGTLDIIERYRSQIGVFVSEPDKGIADAWNKGVKRANGQWLYFLGADDELADPETLALVAKQLEALPQDQLIAYGHVEIIDNDNGNVHYGGPWEKLAPRYKYMSNLHHQGVFHHRKLFEKVGLFDLSFRIALDYELLQREIRQRPPAYLGNILIARCKVGGLSTNYKYRSKVLAEFRRANVQAVGEHFSLGWELQRLKAVALDTGFKMGLGPLMLMLNKWKRICFR